MTDGRVATDDEEEFWIGVSSELLARSVPEAVQNARILPRGMATTTPEALRCVRLGSRCQAR